MNFIFAETLESRMLLSASPSPLSDAVILDRAQIHVDLLKFRTDFAANRGTLLGDLMKIKADGGKNNTTLKPLVEKYRSDLKLMESTLKQDRLTEKQNVISDQKVIVADLKQILKDHGNAEALVADRAKLLSDRIKLQNDMIAGLSARIATRQAFSSLLVDDGQAIVDAVNADVNASDALKADVVKWSTDRNAADTLLSDDLTTIITHRSQLVSDLTAMQSA